MGRIKRGPRVLQWDTLPLKREQTLNIRELNALNTKYANLYRFKDADPALEQVRSVIRESGETANRVAKAASVATTTVINILNKKTKRPQNATVEAIFRSLGYRRELVRDE